MKSFYSHLDAMLLVPQPVQHLVIRAKAERAGGAVVFYGSEETRTVLAQSVIRVKLRRTQGLDGVIFYQLAQFRYGDRLNAPLMQEILAMGLEVHFACEDISLRSQADLDRWLDFLLVVDQAQRRDRTPAWQNFVASEQWRDAVVQ